MAGRARVAVLDDYGGVALRMADWSAVQARCDVTVFDRPLGVPGEAAEALAPFDVVCHLRERMPFPLALIERLPRLKLVTVTGLVHRTLDLPAALARGITVSHGADRPGSGSGTPELAWGLILSLLRHIPHEAQRMRDGKWQGTVGTQLFGRTLDLVGLGKLGARMAAIGKAFGMEVIAWSQNLTAERAASCGARRVEKEELFRRADVVSLHVVLGERTRGLVGAAELGAMQPGAVLINTARGPLVDEAALLDALRRGRIAGAGIDVYDREPLPAGHPLRQAPNVVLTPHLGYCTEESYRAFYGDTVENILAWLDGAPIRVAGVPQNPLVQHPAS